MDLYVLKWETGDRSKTDFAKWEVWKWTFLPFSHSYLQLYVAEQTNTAILHESGMSSCLKSEG